MKKRDFKTIEKKWQDKWEKEECFRVKKNPKKKKFYILEMFPYPSASGLHMGHAFNYTVGDIYARFKRMQGFNVLYPMGYDSLGLPAENAAIKAKSHPKKFTEKAIENFIKQQKALGLSYDWSRMIITLDPEYYKWNQYFFLQFLKKGLAYRKKAPVNYCPKCNTVLANEQVHNGKCWRHEDTDVEIRHLEQWFLKTTKYADELYEKIDSLKGWPDKIKAMQENWIGKSHGIDVDFKVKGKKWKIFTTRPDTIFGVTFMVISAQHERLIELVTDKQQAEVKKFLKKLKSVSEKELEDMEKEGVFTGSYAVNPVNNEKIPIWVGNFVLADYGSGMVMAVPAHDQRDWEFAKKYNIEIREVIKPEKGKSNLNEKAYTDEGKLINSGKFNKLNSKKAIQKISDFLERKGWGKRVVNFKLRDWLISRQRYWGTPIPIIYCDKCGIVPVPEKDLPVKLPEKVKFGKGNPLASAKSWIKTKCPKCRSDARRETDTMDTFFDSSWYFLRYCDNKNNKKPFDKKKTAYWMPVDQYIGGAEHACMHLIYARFFTKALRDLKIIKKINEPFDKLFNQGMLHGKDGFVMSKSRGNVIDPLEIISKYSTDILRMSLISTASPDSDVIWSNKSVEGISKFLNRIFSYFSDLKTSKSSPRLESKINKTIKEMSKDIEDFKYNLAIIKLRGFFEFIKDKPIGKKDAEGFLKLLHIFCPHITEELWQKIGNNKTGKRFLSLESWPRADEKKISEKFEKQEKAQRKIIEDINNIIKIIKSKGQDKDKVFIYTLPKEKEIYNANEISEKTGKQIKIFSVSDKNKYDPTNKSKNSRPEKPAIYIE
jgi:leucyl-tRNA synthetase